MGNKNNKLKIENERDKFTGLYNRETAEKKCRRLIQENFDTYGVFLFIDIDDLKYCNDTYGHVAGDEMIRKFSEKLKGIEGKKVICSRIAGDEFSIFKIGYNSVAEIHEDLVNFTENLAFDFKVNHKINIPITMSVGGSIYNLDTQDFQELVKFADFAMYQGKGEKKKKPKEKRDNVTIELFNKQMCKKYSNEITKTIIEKKQLYSVYQTINQLGGKEIYGYEGLTRPFNTNISNIIELIELADLHGELNNLDLLMMESIVRGFNGNGKLFINMEYKEPKFVEEYINKLIEIVMEVGISPENIVIEVSERKQWALESINLLKLFRKKYNFLIAIDDFGAGFANNYLLMELRPEIVKIDRSLITNVHKEKGKYEYLVTLSEFIKKQDIKIIYEGVELKEEIEVISEISLDYAQGWFFGKPVEMNSKIPDGNSPNQNNPKVTPPVPVI